MEGAGTRALPQSPLNQMMSGARKESPEKLRKNCGIESQIAEIQSDSPASAVVIRLKIRGPLAQLVEQLTLNRLQTLCLIDFSEPYVSLD